jgi:hypothetical protein
VIRSNAGGTQVEFFDAGEDRCLVRLSRRELEAEREVYELERHETLRGLAALFAELAEDWRGWDGERVWVSLEGELAARATHNGLGTVELVVTLGELEPKATGMWSAQASLFLDAGGLDRMAQEAAAAMS